MSSMLVAAPRCPTMPVLSPAPVREPPFDDELQPARHQHTSPWDQHLPFIDDVAGRGLHLDGQSQPSRRPPGIAGLPAPGRFARRFVIAVIETATGRRPAAQLRDHTSPGVHTGLVRDAGRIGRLGTAARPATLHSLHLAEPADGVVEVAAVILVADRFRALAFRLEGLDGRWRCVRLQIG